MMTGNISPVPSFHGWAKKTFLSAITTASFVIGHNSSFASWVENSRYTVCPTSTKMKPSRISVCVVSCIRTGYFARKWEFFKHMQRVNLQRTFRATEEYCFCGIASSYIFSLAWPHLQLNWKYESNWLDMVFENDVQFSACCSSTK